MDEVGAPEVGGVDTTRRLDRLERRRARSLPRTRNSADLSAVNLGLGELGRRRALRDEELNRDPGAGAVRGQGGAGVS